MTLTSTHSHGSMKIPDSLDNSSSDSAGSLKNTSPTGSILQRSLKIHVLSVALLGLIACSVVAKILFYDVLKPVQFAINNAWSKRPGLICDNKAIAQQHLTAGKHHIVDMYGITQERVQYLENFAILPEIEEYITSAGLTLLDYSAHHFECGGITAVFLLSESHVSLHSWPEHGFVALDVYTCGSGRPDEITEKFKQLLKPKSVKHTYVERGLHMHTATTPLSLRYIDFGTNTSSVIEGRVHDVENVLSEPLVPIEGYQRSNICVNGDDDDDDCFLLRNVIVHADVQSPYQHVEVIDTNNLGRCMLLDRVIQFCEEDNEKYTRELTQNAMSQILGTAMYESTPLLEPVPRLEIVIIGGGDGWVASHLLDEYAPHIKSIQIVDIDEQVAILTRKYFEEEGDYSSFTDQRVKWTFGDASAWLNNLPGHVEPGTIDFVIIDCTDHTKEASKVLYTNEFYSNVHRLLKPNGKVVQQMNTVDESYEPFLALVRKQWREIGLSNLLEWTHYLQSYSGMSVFWLASKE